MTEPTDAEILDAADDFSSQYMHGGITFDEFDSISFARAVLAKWGTPAPVEREPLTHAQAKALVLKYGNDPLHLVYQVEVAHGITQKGGRGA